MLVRANSGSCRLPYPGELRPSSTSATSVAQDFSVDSHSVYLSQVRRRAAALLLFLASRPGQTAGRESVLDALWPDATPHDALNSLHQALYYLRRCIDQWYEDSTSPDYVVLESEIVYLDPNLVAVDSVLFNREASMIIGSKRMDRPAVAALATYRGVFALEFEYEEWAIDYRTQTHALYLRLVQEVAEAQIAARDYHDAAAGLELALRIDPTAFELGAYLVKALWHQGSRAAAFEHYKLYARLHEREAGDGAAESRRAAVTLQARHTYYYLYLAPGHRAIVLLGDQYLRPGIAFVQ